MLKKVLAATVLTAGCFAGAAQAAPTFTTSFTAGSTGMPTLANTVVVQSFDTIAPGTSIGTNANVYAATQPGTAIKPTTATGNFAAALQNGSYSISFAPTTVFGFVLGTLDTYDMLLLSFSDGTSTSLTGGAITNGLSGTGAGAADGFVSYSFAPGAALTGATFGAGAYSFEFDTIEAGVPEPAAWGMMILGFGLIGGVLRRRSAPTVRFA